DALLKYLNNPTPAFPGPPADTFSYSAQPSDAAPSAPVPSSSAQPSVAVSVGVWNTGGESWHELAKKHGGRPCKTGWRVLSWRRWIIAGLGVLACPVEMGSRLVGEGKFKK
ncbi:hypothetical protein AAFF_G00367340, partial [Aldrovandia affinis]